MTEPRKSAVEMLRDLFDYWPANSDLRAALDEALIAEYNRGYENGRIAERAAARWAEESPNR